MNDFVHLHVHSHYSLLDGLGKIDDLIARAKEFDMSALALTDHGAMYGAIEFYEKARAAGIKPIIGCELYVSQGPMTERPLKGEGNYYHLLVLAENETGYKNLLKLVTDAHLLGYYYRPRIDKELLKRHAAGLIASSGCLASEIPRKISEGDEKGARKALDEYLEIFGQKNFYLELQDHPEFEDQQKVNRTLVKWAKEYGLPTIVTADTHYVRPEDKDAHEVLLAVQQGKLVDDADRLSFAGADFSLKEPKIIAANFKDVPQALAGTAEIGERCSLTITLGKPILPQFPTPKDCDAFSYLKKLVEERLPGRYGKNPSQEIRERLAYELSVIEKTGFADYFLIVADYVNWAKDQGIVVGPGRGSAAGSIVSYILGITDLDPMGFGLLFERFLNPDRPAMPDIDIDFQDDRREEVIRYMTKKYGDDRVAQIITFGVMKARLAVRDVTRALGLPYQLGDQVAKQIPMSMDLDQALQNSPELKRLVEGDPNVKRVVDMSKRLEGVVRHASTHAAGVVIGRDPLVNYTPLQHSTRGELAITTQYSMKPIEDLGLLKMDILGLANLTIIKNCLRIVRKVYGEEVDITKVGLNDQKTYELLGRGEAIAVFQFESGGMREYLKRLKPTNINDLIALVALYRPGPIELIPDYINAKHGRRKVEYLHPSLEPILKDTHGIMIYQEQVMEIAQAFAGFSKGEGYVLVKGIAKKIKEIVNEQKERFIEGAVKQGNPKKVAEQLFRQIEPFARYGFNRAHSACYATIAYWTAYLKAHYPAAYMAAVMTSDFGNQDRIAIEIEEATKMGLEVLPPDVNESFVEFGIVPNSGPKYYEKIRFGLSAIKNVGVGVAAAIQEVRQKDGPYQSLADFLTRLGSQHLNRKVLESLAKAGALDRWGERNQLVAGVDTMLKLTGGNGTKTNQNQMGLFQAATSEIKLAAKMELPPVDPADKAQRLAWEKEMLGLYLSDHPLKEVAPIIRGVGTPLGEIGIPHVGNKIRVAGILTSVKRIVTKNGQQMAFANLEDTTGRRELVIFPKIYEAYNGLLVPDKVLVAEGTVNMKEMPSRGSYEQENEEEPTEEAKVLVDRIWEIGEQGSLEHIPPFEPGQSRPNGRSEGGPDTPKNGNGWYGEPRSAALKSRNREFIEEVEEIGPPVLYLTIPKGSPPDTLQKIKEVMIAHPGETTVICRIPTDSEWREVTAKTRVELNEHLQISLAKILGDAHVSVR